MQRIVKKAVWHIERTTALGLFVVYCLWNLFWLFQWRIPPSLFWAFTKLPCPTTGCTRSVMCLLRGEIAESLRWNLLTIPILVLFSITVGCVGLRLANRQPLQLHGHFLRAWGLLLAVAWLCKLFGNSNYW